jgi:acyl carrier protein
MTVSDARAQQVIQESFNALLARGAFDREIEIAELSPESTLDDIGLDSVTTAMLLQEIEDSTNVVLPEEELMSMDNFGQFVDLVARALAEKQTSA